MSAVWVKNTFPEQWRQHTEKDLHKSLTLNFSLESTNKSTIVQTPYGEKSEQTKYANHCTTSMLLTSDILHLMT